VKSNHLRYGAAIFATAFLWATLAGFVSAQNGQGKIIASIAFNPQADGFSFRNYGYRAADSNDLGVADLIQMFGAEKVCIEGRTAADCVLYETAARWLRDRLAGMNNGHCDGFSVASMRTWLKLPFKGKIAPKEWQTGVDVTNGLEFDDRLANYIAYYHSLQGLKEVNTFRMESFKLPPTEIVRLLIESFRTGKEYYTLGVGMRINGKYSKGHSILPFAVEETAGGVFKIHVYDNNYPDEIKYLTVDAKTETWRYHTASDPSARENDYVGDRKTETLSLKKMSDRNLRLYDSPFSEVSGGEGAARVVKTRETINFSFDGEGDLLIADPNKKQIGYDRKKKAEINQIPGADIVYDDGGLGLDYPPGYILPYDGAAKNPYLVTISGRDLDKETRADLEISAPGFVVGFEDIRLDPGEELTVSVAPDGETLAFTASADGEAPTIYITTEDGPDKPSYALEVGGVSIEGGKTLTMTVDIDRERVYFRDNDGNEDAYDIHFERTAADGGKIEFEIDDLDLKGSDNFQIRLDKWDDEDQPCIEDDDDGDGFDDETCEEIEINGNI